MDTALRRAGGTRVAADATKLVPARAGDALVSSAGDLPVKYILPCGHAGHHYWKDTDRGPRAELMRTGVPLNNRAFSAVYALDRCRRLGYRYSSRTVLSIMRSNLARPLQAAAPVHLLVHLEPTRSLLEPISYGNRTCLLH